MNEVQTKFLEVSKYYEQLKDKLDLAREELEGLLKHMPLNSYYQDPATMAVYKIVKPKGTFVQYRDVDYVRTALEGEVKGSLSKKEVEEQGFYLKK
jgi:hypothetical protein